MLFRSDIRTARIEIEDGAYFKGNIDIVRTEPKPAAAPAAAPKPQAVAGTAPTSSAVAAGAETKR